MKFKINKIIVAVSFSMIIQMCARQVESGQPLQTASPTVLHHSEIPGQAEGNDSAFPIANFIDTDFVNRLQNLIEERLKGANHEIQITNTTLKSEEKMLEIGPIEKIAFKGIETRLRLQCQLTNAKEQMPVLVKVLQQVVTEFDWKKYNQGIREYFLHGNTIVIELLPAKESYDEIVKELNTECERAGIASFDRTKIGIGLKGIIPLFRSNQELARGFVLGQLMSLGNPEWQVRTVMQLKTDRWKLPESVPAQLRSKL